MAIINEIKCARCDRKYSGVRSRCPYCGARRIGRGKYSEDSDNAKGKMLISVLIMAVFTVAAGILLFTTPIDADAGEPEESPPTLSTPEDDINHELGLAPDTPTPQDTPEPIVDAPTNVIAIAFAYEGSVRTDISLFPGERIGLDVMVEPPGVVEANNMRITWSSSDEDRFEVVPVLHNGNNYKATVVGIATESGSATLTVTVGDPEDGGMEHSIPIRYRRKP